MLISVQKRCYNFAEYRDEYKIIPYKCPLNSLDSLDDLAGCKLFCVGGFVWIGDEKPEYSTEQQCKYYDADSFKVCDNCIECNYELEVENVRK